MEKSAINFWDNVWSNFKPFNITSYDFTYLSSLLNLIGDVNGKDILDLGCGDGELSVYLAKKGANVTAIDISKQSINNLKILSEYNNVRINGYAINAMDLEQLNKKFDLVVGKFILHHIEPFNNFVNVAFNILNQNGRGIFFENSSRNKILMFFRQNVVGKFGVPKYGDEEEYPFEPREINMLKSKFGKLKVYYPEFKFFIMLGTYIFKNKKAEKFFKSVDEFFYKYIKIFNKYSYNQIIEFKKTN